MAERTELEAPARDDWRLTGTLEEEERLPLLRRLGEATWPRRCAGRDASAIVTHGAGKIFAYLVSETAARATDSRCEICSRAEASRLA